MARRLDTDPAQTRERILEAADVLFGEHGFDATATRLIAERSGVNKALIHYHFSTKEALFGAVLDRYYARLGRALRPVLEAEGPARQKLLALLDGYVDFLAANQTFHRLVQREIAGGRHLERILGHTMPLFALGTQALAAAWPATASGPLGAADLLVSFHGLIISSFTYGPVLAGLSGEDPLAPGALARRKAHLRCLAGLVMDALEAPAARATEPGQPNGAEGSDDTTDADAPHAGAARDDLGR